MIYKALKKPLEIEFAMFEGRGSFDNIVEFLEVDYPLIKYTVNNLGAETIDIDGLGTFTTGEVFYRKLNGLDSEDGEVYHMPKKQFLNIFEVQ